MLRWIILAGVLFVLIRLAILVAQALGYPLDLMSFFAGIGVSALVGLGTAAIHGWWGTATRPTHPQSVQLFTQQTPLQVTQAGIGGLVRFVVAMVVLGITIAVLLGVVRLSDIVSRLGPLLSPLVSPLR